MLTPASHARHIPLAGSMTIFLLGGLAGLAASYDAALSARWLLWLTAGAALYIAIVTLARTPKRLIVAAALPVLAAAAGGLLLAAQYRHLGFDRKFGVVARLGELLSAPFPIIVTTHIDANAAAGFLEGALPLAIGLMLATGGWRRVAWASSALLIALGVLLTASRGSWVALAVGALLGGLALARRRLKTKGEFEGEAPSRTPLPLSISKRGLLIIVIVGLAGIAMLVVGQTAAQQAFELGGLPRDRSADALPQ